MKTIEAEILGHRLPSRLSLRFDHILDVPTWFDHTPTLRSNCVKRNTIDEQNISTEIRLSSVIPFHSSQFRRDVDISPSLELDVQPERLDHWLQNRTAPIEITMQEFKRRPDIPVRMRFGGERLRFGHVNVHLLDVLCQLVAVEPEVALVHVQHLVLSLHVLDEHVKKLLDFGLVVCVIA
jgi:hypothetical protein